MTEAEVFHKIQLIEAAIEELRAATRPVNPAPKYVDFPTAIHALVYEGKNISLYPLGRRFRITAPMSWDTYCVLRGGDILSKNWVIEEKEIQE